MNVSDWREEEEPEFFSSEQRLMQALVGHYENSVRPVYNASDPVDVKLGLTLTQILDLVGDVFYLVVSFFFFFLSFFLYLFIY